MPSPPARILVVDDEPLGAELLARALRPLGEVEIARSAEEAWSTIEARRPDVVITDQRLPGQSGVDLLTRLAMRDEHVGRILVTAFPDIAPTIDAINRGRVHAYVGKPWVEDQVRLVVRTLLERVALGRDHARLVADLVEKNRTLRETMASLRSTQERVVDAERSVAVARMIAMIVHDFRGPLSVIRSASADLARYRDEMPAEEFAELARSISEEAERMVRMCADLLEVTRAGRSSTARIVAPLDEVAREALTRMADEAARAGVVLESDLASQVVRPLDVDGLRRALLNLAFNAVEAMPDGGILRIRTWRDGDQALISVEDTGPGIPAEIRDRLFEPFVTFGKPAGSGLGLAVVKKVAEDHGGSVSLGKAEGGGTAVVLRIPASATHSAGADTAA